MYTYIYIYIYIYVYKHRASHPSRRNRSVGPMHRIGCISALQVRNQAPSKSVSPHSKQHDTGENRVGSKEGPQGATPRTRQAAPHPDSPPSPRLNGEPTTARGLQFLHAHSRAPGSQHTTDTRRRVRRPAPPSISGLFYPDAVPRMLAPSPQCTCTRGWTSSEAAAPAPVSGREARFAPGSPVSSGSPLAGGGLCIYI